MSHIDLRAVHDDDLDEIFEMMREPDSVAAAAFTASDPDDRAAFDEWMLRHRASDQVLSLVITENGSFVGTIAAFTIEVDREVTYWVARRAAGRGIATEALRQLVSLEAERPLFARVASHNAASIAVLAKVGFTEVSRNVAFAPGVGREVEEIVMVLVPTLE